MVYDKKTQENEEIAKKTFKHVLNLISNPKYSEGLIEHSSWQLENLKPWLEFPLEKFEDANAKSEIVLDIDLTNITKSNWGCLPESISGQLMKRLSSEQGIRGRLVYFTLRKSDADRKPVYLDKTPLEKLWDGLRTLPYDNQELADGLANCIMLHILWQLLDCTKFESWASVANRYFGESIEVEFGPPDSSYSRSFVSKQGLIQAVRPDLQQLKPEYYNFLNPGNISDLLLRLNSPKLLFDFRKLAHLFATQICPIQVLSRSLAIFYSPAQLDAFGLP